MMGDVFFGALMGFFTAVFLAFVVLMISGASGRTACTDLTGGECVRKWVPAQ